MFSKPQVLVVIPARYASKRLPGKLLMKVNGIPIIKRIVELVRSCTLVDHLVVATDDHRIEDALREVSVEVVVTDGQFDNGTLRVAHVMKSYQQYDIVVNVQADQPFLNIEGLTSLIEAMHSGSRGVIYSLMSTAVCDDPSEHVVKVLIDEHHMARRFDRALMPDEVQYKHIGVYGFRRATMEHIMRLPMTLRERELNLEQLRWIEHGLDIRMISCDDDSVSINVASDIAYAEKHLGKITIL